VYRHILCVGLAASIAALAALELPAQQSDFYKKPTTAAEYWRAIRFEVNTGRFEVAAGLIRDLLALNAPEKEMLALVDKEGLAPFLRLRNVERWSDNPKTEAEARKNVEALIERVSAALKKQLDDPARIARLANGLLGSAEEAAFAQREIRRSGAAAIPVLADILNHNPPTELRVAIFDLFPKLDVVTVPPLLAFLDVSDPALKFDLLGALRKRPDFSSLPGRVETDLVPALWYLSSRRMKEPEELRREAQSMLAGLIQLDPEKRQSYAELTALAERIYDHKATFLGGDQVEVWRWDGMKLTSTTVPATAAEEYFGLRYARWALELNPTFLPAQVIATSIALEKAIQRSGPDKPLARGNPALYQIVASAPYELLAEVLDRGLRENRTTVALGALQVLADRAVPEAARPFTRAEDGKAVVVRPALLVRALNYPDRRVQLAAADALLRIPGPPIHGANLRVVEVLRDALVEEPASGAPEKPRALLGDPTPLHADALARLLRRVGFDVETVGTGKDLLRRIHQRPDFAVLFVDHHLPYPLLPDLLAQVRADVKAAPIPLYVVASSERSATPQPLTALARVAALIAVEARDDPAALAAAGKAAFVRRQADLMVRDRQARLLQYAVNAGFPPLAELNNRVEYVSILANAPILFENEDMQRRIKELRPLIRPDETISASTRERIDTLLRSASVIEAKLPAEQLAVLEQTWGRILEQLPPSPSIRDELLENRLRTLTRTYARTKVIPDIFTEAALRTELAGALADPASAPRNEAERRADALLAITWLRRMATGEVPGYDVKPAGDAIRGALHSNELAPQAVEAVVYIPTKEAQQDLANVALAGNRPADLRIKAADALIRHLQKHGNLLGGMQVQFIRDQAKNAEDLNLRSRLQAIEGILQPAAQRTGQELLNYQPALAPSAPAKEDIKEQPKEKEDKKE
jgi:CheY-like chemotaxis protein